MEKYNGWSNRETWCVKLWMDNEESSYRYFQEMMADVKANEEKEYQAGTLADRIKEEFENAYPENVTGVWSDLLTGALAKVNWYEIAKSMLEDE